VSDEIELRIAWSTVTGRGSEARRAREVFDDVVGRHREPHRRYHGVRHVVWVVRHVHGLAESAGPVDLAVALAAAFFHDAVYRPVATDNEERSARLAEHALAVIGWPEPDVVAVAGYVRATAGHVDAQAAPSPGQRNDPVANGRAVFLDADLAILGAEPAVYQAYADGVRAEYAHLDAPAWRAGRAAVVARLLARPALYLTEPARRQWDATARANLTAELAILR